MYHTSSWISSILRLQKATLGFCHHGDTTTENYGGDHDVYVQLLTAEIHVCVSISEIEGGESTKLWPSKNRMKA